MNDKSLSVILANNNNNNNYNNNRELENKIIKNNNDLNINMMSKPIISDNTTMNCPMNNNEIKNLTNLRDVLKASHKMRAKSLNNNNNRNRSRDFLINNNNFDLSNQIEELLKSSNNILNDNNKKANNADNLKSMIDSFNLMPKESCLKFSPAALINPTSNNNNASLCINIKHCYTTIKTAELNDINKENALSTLMAVTKQENKLAKNHQYQQNNSSIVQIRNSNNMDSSAALLLEQIDEELMSFNNNNQNKKNNDNVNNNKCNNLVHQTNSFNRHDLIRRNISIKTAEDKKKLFIYSKNLNQDKKMTTENECTNSKRNSIDQIPFSNVVMRSNHNNNDNNNTKNDMNKTTVKQSASFNLDRTNFKANSPHYNNKETTLQQVLSNNASHKDNLQSHRSPSSSSYWKYDELNDLKMKFMSLLGPNSEISKNDVNQDPGLNINVNNENDLNDAFNKVIDDQTLKFSASQITPISDSDRLKIESFYRSFGTSLFVSSSSASLYTVNNAKKSCSTTNTLQKVPNRNSMQSVRQLNNLNHHQQQLPQTYEVDQDLVKSIIKNDKKLPDNISVSHCGIPLWLFNSGANPRRPNRQLKFTLSEKGTGFILWQDRIDINSHLKMYTVKKDDNNNLICIDNFNQFLLNNEDNDSKINQTNFPILITFRASDKKTSVFIRFDINNEAILFYNHYLDLMKKNADLMSTTQRAKSLPAGLTSSSVYSTVNKYNKSNTCKIDMNKSRFNNNNKYTSSKTGTIASTKNNQHLNFILDMNNNNNTINSRKLKRQSCFITFNSTNKVKKITKNDISHPSDAKHITNIKSNDRNIFYTLSKLLPSFIQTNNKPAANEISSDKISSNNKLTPSPTYSILTSSSSSATSAHLLSDSSNVNLNEENSFNQNNNLVGSNIDSSLSFSSFTKSKSSSASSTSSASSISPSFIKIKNHIDSNENGKSNDNKNHQSNGFTHQLNEMRHFEAKKKSLFSKQKTLK